MDIYMTFAQGTLCTVWYTSYYSIITKANINSPGRGTHAKPWYIIIWEADNMVF